MNCYPKIESPCPMRLRELPAAGRNLCTHCDKTVINLDVLDENQRRAALAAFEDEVCVAYTIRVRPRSTRAPAAALAAALAITSMQAAAQDCAVAPSAAQTAPIWSDSADDAASQSLPQPDCEAELDRIEVTGGGIRRGSRAKWQEADEMEPTEIDGNESRPEVEFIEPPVTDPASSDAKQSPNNT